MSNLAPAAVAPMPWRRIAWLAIRPKTLWLSVSPVAVATALAWRAHSARPGIAALAVLGAFGLQVGTNLLNDWADAATGADGPDRLGPVRVTASGQLAASAVLAWGAVAFAFAVACGAGLMAAAGAWWWLVAAVGISGVACGYAYTSGPMPLAYVGLGEVVAFVYFGPVAVATTYVLQAGAMSPGCVVLGVALGAYAAAVLAINNLRDRAGDARVSKKTPAVRFGAPATRRAIAACLALPHVAVLGLAAVDPALRGAALGALSAGVSWRIAVRAAHHEGAALNDALASAAKAQTLFSALVCFGLWAWPH